MYASIHQYQTIPASTDDLAEVGWRLGAALAQTRGFVAAVVVENAEGVLFTIGLFEDRPSLIAAIPVAQRWAAEHDRVLGPDATAVTSGEVVAQKGL
jgi:hypothetical protein